ncbi:Uncharacterised protein [Vibrio cholerae]|nr:Uncharacterised protein [Vibrio cholerae]
MMGRDIALRRLCQKTQNSVSACSSSVSFSSPFSIQTGT